MIFALFSKLLVPQKSKKSKYHKSVSLKLFLNIITNIFCQKCKQSDKICIGSLGIFFLIWYFFGVMLFIVIPVMSKKCPHAIDHNL